MPNIQQQKKHEMVDSNDESNEDGSIIKAEPLPLTDQSATSLMTHNSSNAEEGGHIISSNGGAQICGGDGTVPMPLTSRWSPCSASSAGNPLLWYETDKCPYCNQKCRKPRRLLDCLHFVCEECVPEQCLLLDNLDPDEIRCPNCSQVEMSSISDQSTESSRVEICSKHKEKLTLFCLSCARLLCVNCEQQLSLPTAQVNTVTNVVAVPQLSASTSNSGALRMKVEEVSSWVNFVAGSDTYGDRFVEEEVDGSSLLCLQYEELKTDLKIKLGPLAKIWKSLEALKEKR
ncbi:hypothetical protein niasHT_039051 [Heterodera trifolii]|uniref:Uncharacterized protein n=1 Tax=Heterodera trifolii TaxID=157864 RepID=A0ABD2HYK5_9BILA